MRVHFNHGFTHGLSLISLLVQGRGPYSAQVPCSLHASTTHLVAMVGLLHSVLGYTSLTLS